MSTKVKIWNTGVTPYRISHFDKDKNGNYSVPVLVEPKIRRRIQIPAMFGVFIDFPDPNNFVEFDLTTGFNPDVHDAKKRQLIIRANGNRIKNVVEQTDGLSFEKPGEFHENEVKTELVVQLSQKDKEIEELRNKLAMLENANEEEKKTTSSTKSSSSRKKEAK